MTVTVQSALTAVAASTRRLREAADELVLFAEDQPDDCQVHLVTMVQDAALDLAAEAAQADTVLTGLSAPGGSSSTARSAVAVARCQRHLNLLGAALTGDIAAPERLDDLATLAREHGDEVAAWTREIVRCVAACQRLIWTDLQPALLSYWQEIAEMTERACAPGDGR